MLRDRLVAMRGTDGRVCGKRHFIRFVAFYVILSRERYRCLVWQKSVRGEQTIAVCVVCHAPTTCGGDAVPSQRRAGILPPQVNLKAQR
eukprot:3197075-Prymnesium_polylepis.1